MSASPNENPLHSTLADDPTAAEPIERFVVSLAERIDELQDADRRGNLDRLTAQIRSLIADAEARGFHSFARCAETLAARCGEEEGDGAHKQLVELTALAHRIRLGHPGAM